jgi:hypothetical protein
MTNGKWQINRHSTAEFSINLLRKQSYLILVNQAATSSPRSGG